MRLTDYLLLHGDIHKKYSRNYYLIIFGVLLVGINDVFFGSHHFLNYFQENLGNRVITVLFYLLLSIIIGVIDVLSVVIPISEFSNYIKKKTEKKYVPVDISVSLSSYILAHIILIIPMHIIIFIIEKNEMLLDKFRYDSFLQGFFTLVFIFMNFIVIAMLVRGLNVHTKMNLAIKFIVFMAAYFWLDLTGIALSKLIQWCDQLFLFLMQVFA